MYNALNLVSYIHSVAYSLAYAQDKMICKRFPCRLFLGLESPFGPFHDPGPGHLTCSHLPVGCPESVYVFFIFFKQ